jgi:hypothetical protein
MIWLCPIFMYYPTSKRLRKVTKHSVWVHRKSFQIRLGTHGNKLLVGRSRDRSPLLSLEIFSEATDGTMCPGVKSASKNEYQDTPGGEGGRCVRVKTLPP